MSRSLKKGPYIDPKLLKKILAQKQLADKSIIKTYSRACAVAPEFVGHVLSIHNGRKFIDVFITEAMVGHKLGEFAPTRTFRGHGKIVKRILAKT